jgi:hypothetical protein
MNVESDLRHALRRERPAPGLAERVLARAAQEQHVATVRSRPRRWRALAASLLLTTVVGGWAAHGVAERRREAGERARDQLLVALRITSAKVREAQHEVHEIGSHND